MTRRNRKCIDCSGPCKPTYRKVALCDTCAFMRMRAKKRIRQTGVAKPSYLPQRASGVCTEDDCDEATIPGAHGPMPSRCPEHWRANNAVRMARCNQKRREASDG